MTDLNYGAFRVWDSERKEYPDWCNFSINEPGGLGSEDTATGEHMIVEPWAHRYDCKGIAIYEGDVLSLYGTLEAAVYFGDDELTWCLQVTKSPISFRLADYKPENLEIVGNIHQELAKDGFSKTGLTETIPTNIRVISDLRGRKIEWKCPNCKYTKNGLIDSFALEPGPVWYRECNRCNEQITIKEKEITKQ